MVAQAPTHFHCLGDGCPSPKRVPLADYDGHLDVHHAGEPQPVRLVDIRCPHGNPMADWLFCCDYENW